MSWVTRINTDFIITTGDNAIYVPSWMSATKEFEYNLTEFNFPGTAGSFIDRREVKGSRYALTIMFQGENNLELSAEFKNSADNKKPWTIEHPMYGRIRVHPSSLKFDDTKFNITTITGVVIETNEEAVPVLEIDPIDLINESKSASDEFGAIAFSLETPNPASMSTNNNTLYSSGRNLQSSQIQAEAYFNFFNDAKSAISVAVSKPLAAIRAMQNVINAPALFTTSVQNRISNLTNQFNLLVQSIETISGQSGKLLFETNAGSLITAMCVACANPLTGNYQNTSQVLSVIDILLGNYNTFVSSLDSLQTDNGGDTDSYIPNFDFATSVSELVSFTISQLFVIAFNAQQERRLFLESDSNVILLAHRFYGLDADDSTIQYFMDTNGIGLSEILGIKKGREIIYYV